MLMPPRFRGAHERHRTDFFADPEPRRVGAGFQLWGLRSNDTEFPIDVCLGPLRTDRGVLVSAAIRDITEQLAVQARTGRCPRGGRRVRRTRPHSR